MWPTRNRGACGRRVAHSVRNAIESDLARLPVRPLVLGGARDTVAPRRWREAVAATCGGVAVTVPGGAHNILTTAGSRCAELIGRHVERCAG
jgi:pimeloyl-ACP methyl ester carboxylesterase